MRTYLESSRRQVLKTPKLWPESQIKHNWLRVIRDISRTQARRTHTIQFFSQVLCSRIENDQVPSSLAKDRLMRNFVYIRIDKNTVEQTNPNMPNATICAPLCSGSTKLTFTPGGGGMTPVSGMVGKCRSNRAVEKLGVAPTTLIRKNQIIQ